jgi:GAF domain-containing protein
MKNSFPFRQILSLTPLIAFWQRMADESDDQGASFIDALLTEVGEHPVLGLDDLSGQDLDLETRLVSKLMSAIFPMATIDRHIAAAIKPFELVPFYRTPAFTDLDLLAYFHPQDKSECSLSEEEMAVARTMKAYHMILERLYGAPSDFNLPFVIGRRNPETLLERFFQIEIDPRFVEIRVKGQKPRLSQEEIEGLLDDPMNLERWRALLPTERFEFSGFGLIRATEVTSQQALSLLKNDLLAQRDITSQEGIDTLELHLRSFLGKSEIRIGIIALEDDTLDHGRVMGRSLLLGGRGIPDCPQKQKSTYARAVSEKKPVVISDLHGSDHLTGLEYAVRELGFESMAVGPLLDNGRVVGLLELASPNKGDLSLRMLYRLSEVAPLLTTALKRSMEERENRIQSLIKKQFTAIHPIVEWRFREAAMAQMDTPDGELGSPIVFEGVQPLYGLSDVRNSSTFRNDAIRSDLTEQLGLALAVIIEASSVSAQPALDELGFRLRRQIDALQDGLAAGEESEPVHFLRHDIEPLFDKLGALGVGVAKKVDEYRAALDPDLQMVYRQRKDFEVSITRVNDALSRFIESRDEAAQELAPHYFEKYRTDGVDYNIYAGAALRADSKFDDLDLRNLRLWQLMTMAGCVWELEALRPELPIPLEAAHLILVQSQPLAIRFRADEKKFDVDGAYNIRYEIVKKRIDKARIRGTSERLTQPGQIAIVFSLASEQREYLRYIEYLQAAGYLEAEVEHLELEPLQGVQGLRAMRVTVPETPPVSDILIEILPANITLAD